MSAPGSGDASGSVATAHEGAIAGADRIRAAALTHTAQAVAAEALDVTFRDIRAAVSDDGNGALAVEIRGPLPMSPLGSGEHPADPILRRTHRARGAIAERFHSITGRRVERVTVIYTSSTIAVRKRVQ